MLNPVQLAFVQGDPLPKPQLTLPELLHRAAGKAASITYLHNGNTVYQSYADLFDQAQRISQGLKIQGINPQDPVLLQLHSPQNFIATVWGCILGGFVPVVLAVAPQSQISQSHETLLSQAINLFPNSVVLTQASQQLEINATLPHVNCVAFETLLQSAPVEVSVVELYTQHCQPQLDDLCLLILTSGSTGTPKAVQLSHRNILASVYGMATANGLTAEDITFNWMPLEHVASLVMFHFTPLFLGCDQIHADSQLILSDPLQWLHYLERYRVTASWAPNFAYGLVNEQLIKTPPKTWDLSAIHWLGNGAEAVVGKTARQFLELLAPYNLAETAVSPGYGMSETCSGITHSQRFSLTATSPTDEFVEVGRPIPGVSLRIVDEQNQIVPEGTVGMLQVQGATITSGYYGQPELTATAFTRDGWFITGDLGFLRAGCLTITGRQKDVIIVNGVNYYSHEIEAVVEELPGVEVSYTAACGVRPQGSHSDASALFFHPSPTDTEGLSQLIRQIRQTIFNRIGIHPNYIIPVEHSVIPKTAIGKIQRQQLVQRFQQGEFDAIIQQTNPSINHSQHREQPRTPLEHQLAQIWQDVLGIEAIGIRDNFFELGGNSLLLMQVWGKLQTLLEQPLSVVDLFQYPTIQTLAQRLNNTPTHSTNSPDIARKSQPQKSTEIAIIGIGCRFPGANTPAEFWQNLANGVESIQFFSDEEILATGVDPQQLNDPNYIKASPVLDNITDFDADFFGYSPKEAELIDPQQRLLLECAWESLEDAGYSPFNYPGEIGLYAGAATNTYFLNNIYPNRNTLDSQDNLQVFTLTSLGGFQATVANDKDYLTTRVSYKLNLTGPSVNVQTACSTSLVAVHLACQSLIQGECDLALAGGVSVHVPQTVGYLYQEGMMTSADGHCRAFDAQASGTVFGSGAGLVVLKRLDQAIADRDRIYAVIKGSAVNNDGGTKVGYLAPNGIGQARVVASAIANAGIPPETIDYIEAHGTGTLLGDPIEITALTQGLGTKQKQTCVLGSVKTNVGHLQIASGIAGLIKAALAVHYGKIPPTLHFNQPNDQIDFTATPFYINTTLQDWPSVDRPRRASVNSLGIGGTNVHVVLEEKRQRATGNGQQEKRTIPYFFTLSAKTPQALQELAQKYLNWFELYPDLNLADVCFTTNVGRSHFNHRLAIEAENWQLLKQQLQEFIQGKKPVVSDDLAQQYLQGIEINWSQFYTENLQRVSLPTYPFQRQRYWIDPPKLQPSLTHSSDLHPLLGQKISSPLPATLFQNQISQFLPNFLQDHKINNQVILPATAYLEIALTAVIKDLKLNLKKIDSITIKQFEIQQPIVFSNIPKTLQTVIQKQSTDIKIELFSLAAKDEWQCHSTCRIEINQNPQPQLSEPFNPQQWQLNLTEISPEQHYQNCQQQGLFYGSHFRGIQQLWQGKNQALGLIQQLDLTEIASYWFHPALLDACLQVIFAALPANLKSLSYLPKTCDQFCFYHSPKQPLWAFVKLQQATVEQITANVQIFDNQGLVVEIQGITAINIQSASPTQKQLIISERGSLEQLKWATINRKSPNKNEVEIAVKAVGLNFRDVLNVLGKYPGEAGLLGLECSGEIVAIGENVTDFAVGDAVIAITPGSFAEYVTVNTALVVPKPNYLSFEAAATMPVALLTAVYTLQHLAQLQPGERVLIHAAAGGVGLAAVQVAQQLGAEIFATASPEKWDNLRSLGIQHLFNSRTLDFADEMIALTQGQGIDVILNSLAGEFRTKSLTILSSGGRFIEIGKPVETYPVDGVYFEVDLLEITQNKPELIQTLLHSLIQNSHLKPLPHTVFSGENIEAAFRYMQQAKHIGKIVISPIIITSQHPTSNTLSSSSDLMDYICLEVANILGINPNELEIDQDLDDLGMNSLSSVELRNRLQTRFNCKLSATLIFDYPTIAELTDYIETILHSKPQPQSHPSLNPELEAIQQLSEAEAEALLQQELNNLGN